MNENKNQHELNVCLDECLLYIHSFLKGKKTVVKTLQIGLADGKLANTIVNATQKPHIVVDPRQEMQQFAGIKFVKAENNWDYETEYTYTNDGFLKRKSSKNYDISDFAWYRSSVHFDSKGRITQIDKGWSYD